MARISLALGEMTFVLCSIIALWDIRNPFLLWLAGAGIVMLGLGLALE